MIVAMLVAPILAVIAYFATDMMVGEKPHAAKPGELYKLLASSNCRYESGKCTLNNGEIRADVRAARKPDGGWTFTLESNQNLDMAAIAIVPANDTATSPQNMSQVEISENDEVASKWALDIGEFDKENDLMRVALFLNESFYFVETMAIFPEFISEFQEQ